jgi:hypothetical protein
MYRAENAKNIWLMWRVQLCPYFKHEEIEAGKGLIAAQDERAGKAEL